MQVLKKIAIFLAIAFVAAQLIVVATAYVWIKADKNRTASSLVANILSKSLPQIFWERNNRVIWPYGWFSRSTRVWGYVDKHSIIPGETFNLMLSTGPDWDEVTGHVEIFRIGYYGNSDRELMWKSGSLTVKRQNGPSSAASIGPGWPPLIRDIPTANWKSGFHEISFVTEQGKRKWDFAFIVVTNPSFSGDILMKLSTNTYQAYNHWGGHSFYNGHFIGDFENEGHIISFDRPTRAQFHRWEYLDFVTLG